MAAPSSLNALAVARGIAERLDEDGLPYGIGGALALGAWGAPRATKDVDITIFVVEAELPRAFAALERAGVMIDRAGATRDVAQIGMFKGRAGRMFVDVFVTGHPQYEAMRQRCVAIDDPVSGRTLSFISAEDLCLHKLLYGRPKDLIDLEQLVARRPSMDLAYVRGWLQQMVPVGDARLGVLDDLETRFAGGS
jgi:hypothetical protein